MALASQITLGAIDVRPSARAAALAAAADEELMAGFRAAGAEDAFEELVRRHSGSGYRAALAMLGNSAAAEDAVQECFLRLVRARGSYVPGSLFSSWFYAILRNVCRDELRRAPHPVAGGAAPPAAPAGAEPFAHLETREAAQAAARAFAQLPESDREVLALRIHGGLEFAQIAAACGISAEAAKKRACRALDLLRRALSGRLRRQPERHGQ